MTNKEKLNKLYKDYALATEDIFVSPQGWKIITRPGIDKIQALSKIDIKYEVVKCEKDFVVVKAYGDRDGRTVETFGEASPDTTRQKYLVAMAEKRAMSRIVLKLTGFYELGVMGEDEADDFSKEAGLHRQKL